MTRGVIMTVFRIWNDEVLTKDEFLDRALSKDGAARLDAAGKELRDKVLATKALESEGGPGVTQFVPIGLGRPLTILIRDVYTGAHPRRSMLGGARPKPMAVMTALKDYAAYAPASRAVNFLERNISQYKHIKAPAATSAGTNIVAYSPAVLSDQMHYSIEMAFDTFPEGLFATVASAFEEAAGIPLLLPAAQYLLGAGGLIKIAAEWADGLLDGRAAFTATDSLDFNVPGVAPPAADFRVLGTEEHRGLKYDTEMGLVNSAGEAYRGDAPYFVVSLDGAERKELEKFAPTLAAAEQLKQFLAMKDGAEASVEAVLSGLKLWNDLNYRKEAEKLQGQIAAEKNEKRKADLAKRLDALNANILSEELKVKAN